jgi:hypothetical protein
MMCYCKVLACELMGDIEPPLMKLSGDAKFGKDCKGYWSTEVSLSSYLCLFDLLLVIVAAVVVR